MKRLTPTRDWRFSLAIGMALCAGVGMGQARRGGGPSYHSRPTFRQQGPTFRQQGPAFRQQGPAFRQGGPEGYRAYGPQQQYRAQGMQPGRYAQQQNPAPVERRTPQQSQPNQVQSSQLAQIERRNSQVPGSPRGEHLADWMNQHRNLTPEQQQQALEREPGFSQLPQQTQQRYRNQLARLNAMDPQRRERILAYNERMEHLSVGERTEVRSSLSQLGSLPPEQRRQVAQAWRNLRDLPSNQQAAAMSSPQYQYMNPSQRSTLNNLLRVSPLLPPTER